MNENIESNELERIPLSSRIDSLRGEARRKLQSGATLLGSAAFMGTINSSREAASTAMPMDEIFTMGGAVVLGALAGYGTWEVFRSNQVSHTADALEQGAALTADIENQEPSPADNQQQ